MINAIIFDFDGVLADSEHINIEAGVRVFGEIGHELNGEERKYIAGKHSKDTVPYIIKSRGINIEEEVIVQRFQQLYNELWESDVLAMPAIKEALHALKKKGIVLAIATNNRKARVDIFIDRFGLDDIFSIIIGNEDITKRKPDPEVYLKAIEKLGLPSEVIIAVEDSAVGLQAAKAAGLRCAVIPNQYTIDHDFLSADFVLKSAHDLLGLI